MLNCRPVVRNFIDNEEPCEPVRSPPPHRAKRCTLVSLSATENKNATYYAMRKNKGKNILLVRTSRHRQMVVGIYMQKILPSQSTECIFLDLSRGSPNSATLKIYIL